MIQLAVGAMEELLRVARAGQTLWITSADGSTEIMNEEEYLRGFSRAMSSTTSGFHSEASRETAIVMMNSANLVEILMDVVNSSIPLSLSLNIHRHNI